MGLSLRSKLYAIDKKKEPLIKLSSTVSSAQCKVIHKSLPVQLTFDSLSPYLFPLFSSEKIEKDIPLNKLLMIDTETTGLSRGVGTVAFLIGVGYIEENQLIVEQYLIEDYHQERDLLSSFAKRFSAFEGYITFNGKSYDIPLLQSRFLMNKLPIPDFSISHIDLLHPARRNWKLRLQQCTLQNLEEEILHLYRENDLPGSLIPKRYFQYIKTKNFVLLEDIILHNQQDLLSLFLLFQKLCSIYLAPEQQTFFEDLYSTGKQLEKVGDYQQAYRCYQLSAKGKVRAPAYLALGKGYQKNYDIDKAIEVYQKMIEENQGALLPYIHLSKIYEHRKKDISSALYYTEKGLSRVSDLLAFPSSTVQKDKNDLQYRYMRLLRKKAKEA